MSERLNFIIMKYIRLINDSISQLHICDTLLRVPSDLADYV